MQAAKCPLLTPPATTFHFPPQKVCQIWGRLTERERKCERRQFISDSVNKKGGWWGGGYGWRAGLIRLCVTEHSEGEPGSARRSARQTPAKADTCRFNEQLQWRAVCEPSETGSSSVAQLKKTPN